MLTSLIYSCWSVLLAGHSVVVVDATSNQPLLGVVVRELSSNQVLTTDDKGRVELATQTAELELRMIGYAPLRVHYTTGANSVDTIRLLPQRFTLADVQVKPGRAVMVATLPAKSPIIGGGILPGQSHAMLLPPPALEAGEVAVVDHVGLFLREKPREGRLRVKIVQVTAAGEGNPAHPSSADLIPVIAEFTVDDMQAASKGQLTVDLSQYNLLLPPDGLAVVVECLPTKLTEQVVKVITPANGRKKQYEVLVTTNPAEAQATRAVPMEDFPMLYSALLPANSSTWFKLTPTRPWQQNKSVSYDIRMEMGVHIYPK